MVSSVVVLSGGQDSTTALFWAKKFFGPDILAVSFDYDQRHKRELKCAAKIAEMAGAKHEIIKLGPVLAGSSPLVNKSEDVQQYASAEVLPGGLEKTFVPARNALFFTIAANRAAVNKCTVLVTGVCEEDYGGYPDCRRVFVDAMANALSEGIYGAPWVFTIHTPLMKLSKADTVRAAVHLPGCMDALAYSHTCYNGTEVPCGHCHACLLRQRGFEQAGVEDPLIARLKSEGKIK